MRCPQPPQARPLSGRKFRSLSRISCAPMRCLCRPTWACFFFFCLSFCTSAFSLHLVGRGWFFSPGGCCCSQIRPQLPHTGPTGLVWCCAGVVSPPGPQNRTQGLTRAFPFVPYLFHFSPTGKGWADLAPVLLRLTQICPQLPHTPSTGQVTDFDGVVSLPGFQNRTQGLTGPSLALTVFS
mgnify:FL=1